jgi:hypothetical protein
MAGRVTNAIPGGPSVPIPVTATDFTNIGQFTLSLEFDTTKVHYLSSSKNLSLPGMTVTYNHPSGNTIGKLVFAWTGASNVTLASESSIVNLSFAYVAGTGILGWAYNFGSVCQYKRYVGGVLTALNDTPKYQFYLNGGISNRTAPVTFAPTIANPVTGPLSIPVTANGFTDIGAFTLNLEYDPAFITYQNTFTKNPAFGSTFQVGDNPGTGSKRLIVVQWYGNSVNLANGATLVTLNFSYPTAYCDASPLTWFDNISSCEYADGPGDVLIDMPQSSYYMNSIVAEGIKTTWTGNASTAWDNSANWNSCGVPDISRNIVIPNVSPHSFPILTTAAFCKTIKIETGATVTVSPTGSITVGNN